MPRRTTGTYQRTIVAGEEVVAFVPAPLPPENPPLALDQPLLHRLFAAERALDRLNIASEIVPSLDWLLYAFVRKEAVLTSQIEGTQATLVDLLRFEAEGDDRTPDADVEEVCNYVRALAYAHNELGKPQGLPLSMRLLNEAHRLLMQGARGSDKQPGEVRKSQNWIGGTRPGNAVFVPPPPQTLPETLAAFEKFIHADDRLPSLIRAGLLHVQFETIHPYLDGNGRVGRMLIALLLEHWELLSRPLLYLSLYFKRHQSEYYRRLSGVRTDGDWEGWLAFFLEGVEVVADDTTRSARELFRLVTADRQRVLDAGSTSLVAARLFEALPNHPVVTVGSVINLLDTTKPTAGRAIDVLEQAGVLVETTGRKRDRQWGYADYLDLLGTGTELSSEGG